MHFISQPDLYESQGRCGLIECFFNVFGERKPGTEVAQKLDMSLFIGDEIASERHM
jgi:hypothetical protein